MWSKLPGSREQWARSESDGTVTIISNREHTRLRREGNLDGAPRNVVARITPSRADEQVRQVAAGRGGRRSAVPRVVEDIDYEHSRTSHIHYDVTWQANDAALDAELAEAGDFEGSIGAALEGAAELIAAQHSDSPDVLGWYFQVTYTQEAEDSTRGFITGTASGMQQTRRTRMMTLGDMDILEGFYALLQEYKITRIADARIVVVVLNR